MIMQFYETVPKNNTGYFAGTGDGLTTVGGQPAERKIHLLDVDSLKLVKTTKSTKNGNYLIMGVDTNKKYLIMVRDFKPDEGEPYNIFGYDWILPANDISLNEQFLLWKSWQV